MCSPTILASMAVSAVGQAYNARQMGKNQQRMQQARNEAALAEMSRQEGYQDEASGYFDESLGNWDETKQDAGLADVERQRDTQIQEAIGAANQFAPTTGSAPDVVNTEIARKVNDAMKSGKKYAQGLARMGAFGDQQFGNNLFMAQQGGKLGEISTTANRSAELLPLEQQVAANNAYKQPNMFGDLLTMAGSAGSMYGMTGGDLFSGWGGSGSSPGGLVVGPGAAAYHPLKPSSYSPIVY